MPRVTARHLDSSRMNIYAFRTFLDGSDTIILSFDIIQASPLQAIRIWASRRVFKITRPEN
jgi:hypothetical protein